MAVRSLGIAGTGMVASQQLVDVIAHNVANSLTTSYKRTQVSFKDLFYQTDARQGVINSEAGDRLPAGIQFGLGVAVGATYKIFDQGPTKITPSVPLNIAIEGNGFLVVTLPSGEPAYTRDGNLTENADGEIVTNNGYIISPGLTLPTNATSITVTADGRVSVTLPDQPDPQEIGQLELAIFNNPSGLQPIANNLYTETAASGGPVLGVALEDGFGSIKQNALEDSNVNSIEEITNLIRAQRGYEFNSKVIQTSDQMYKTATDIKA